ncbi:hypothetical protein [Burkholderia multivorans]|nr:hypothetical protein [Burkholderia multivorans]MDI3300526.1 hypothetical protein [Burkholderia multivorans]MDN8012601.1 hypothetical protein [Burkholderia multivorans]MDN8051407.1 hypothetical protein [Burkholderia multivorans]
MVDIGRSEVARLHNWHRSFCLHMTVGRGTPDNQGAC